VELSNQMMANVTWLMGSTLGLISRWATRIMQCCFG